MPNRLYKEKSPYLQQHSNNPANWYAWEQEAFDKAKNEHKPPFLPLVMPPAIGAMSWNMRASKIQIFRPI